ncbi:glycosyltransferase family 39 protein [Candidatus Woesearchaeota archaeon]|nr:glycosyltransferase family 39 protein [Candidatus Woesearchaeota archaeon]
MDRKLEYAIVAVIFAVFLGIVHKGILVPQPGDENVYYYMGKLVSEGSVPYRDFFYAHPPLQLYILAAAFKLFGFNIAVLKLIPLASVLVTALFVYLTARHLFGSLKGVIALAMYLFSYSIMFNSVFSFGLETATMFLIIGVHQYFVKGRAFIGGLFFGIAGVTRLLALAPAAVIIATAFFRDRKAAYRLSSGLASVFIAVNLLFILFLGAAFVFPVYKFHLLKGADASRFSEYINVVKLNWLLFSLFIISAAMIIIRKEKKLYEIMLPASAYLAILAFMSRVFNFYFIAAFPFMAIGAGHLAGTIIEASKTRKYMWAIVIIISGAFAWNLIADAGFLQKVGFTGFSRGTEIKEFVLSQSRPTTLLFGDSSSTPLIALMTGRSIAFNFVDTNPVVFATGIVDIRKTLDGIRGSDIIFIARGSEGISGLEYVREFVNDKCSLIGSFKDKIEGYYLFYKC